MLLGEVCRVEVNPDYGFGENGYKPYKIPPSANLTFELTMVNYQQVSKLLEI